MSGEEDCAATRRGATKIRTATTTFKPRCTVKFQIPRYRERACSRLCLRGSAQRFQALWQFLVDAVEPAVRENCYHVACAHLLRDQLNDAIHVGSKASS